MNEPIRVLHVIGSMNRGGAEAMIMSLYRQIDKTKVQFDFVENTFEKAAFDDEIESLGGRIFHCPHYVGKNYFQYKKWWKKFFKKYEREFRIVHGHIGSTAAIYLHEANKVGCFTIAHSHSSGTDHSITSILYAIISYPTRLIADYFFACSTVAGVDRFGKKIACSKKCTVLNNAVDISKFRFNEESRNITRRELGIDEDYVIGHVGRFAEVKNHSFLLDIFAEIVKLKPQCKLLLVGGGPLMDSIIEKTCSMGLQEQVVFTGVRSDVDRLVQAMDVFVFPSLFEGLPVTLVEAQTAGLPCVISDKVPSESILTDNLVTVMSLSCTPMEWAKHIIGRLDKPRYDRSKEVREAGYDISATAKWLEEFYLEKYKSCQADGIYANI